MEFHFAWSLFWKATSLLWLFCIWGCIVAGQPNHYMSGEVVSSSHVGGREPALVGA